MKEVWVLCQTLSNSWNHNTMENDSIKLEWIIISVILINYLMIDPLVLLIICD